MTSRQLIDILDLLLDKARAHDVISSRLGDAHDYCDKYLPALGLNVWHAVLDDAIRLRARIEELEERLSNDD